MPINNQRKRSYGKKIIFKLNLAIIATMSAVSLFADVPVEIKEYFAQYLDLIDLYSLLKTCKSWRQIIDEDLGFQKICLANTPYACRYQNRSVRSLFQSLRALKSIKNNDPTYFVFYAPNGSCHEVAKMLIATDGPYDGIFRDYILLAIKELDADMVLAHLLECCPGVAPPEVYMAKKLDQSKEFLVVASILCNVFLKEDEIEADRDKKTLRLVLEYLKRNRDYLLKAWIEDKDTNWSYSDVNLVESCSRVLEYLKNFPEFSFELDVPYATSEPDLYKMPPLVHAAITHNEAIFNLLIKHGAKFDPKEPIIPLYYEYTGQGYDTFRKKLIEMGADVAAPLPKTPRHERQSILSYTLKRHPHSVEQLLCDGAKLLPEEEQEWLSKPPNTKKHAVAIRQKQSPYNPTDYIGILPLFDEELGFSGGREKYLKLLANGSFEFHIGFSYRSRFRYKHTGFYELEENYLILRIKLSKDLGEEDDYYYSFDDFHNKPCTKFLILVNALNHVALIPADYDLNAPAERKIRMMLSSHTSAFPK